MFRPVISYILTSLILLSQVGVPLHRHYCKGALEAISVFFSAKCENHNLPVNLPACCKKAMVKHCSAHNGKKCCDDEVVILKQNITSTTPSFAKWNSVALYAESLKIGEIIPVISSSPISVEGNTSDSGPPIYILNNSLIFYA